MSVRNPTHKLQKPYLFAYVSNLQGSCPNGADYLAINSHPINTNQYSFD